MRYVGSQALVLLPVSNLIKYHVLKISESKSLEFKYFRKNKQTNKQKPNWIIDALKAVWFVGLRKYLCLIKIADEKVQLLLFLGTVNILQ